MNAFILTLIAIVFYIGVTGTDRETGIVILILGSTLFLIIIPLVTFLLDRHNRNIPNQNKESVK